MVAEKEGVAFSRNTDEAPVDGSTPMPIRSNTKWTLGVTTWHWEGDGESLEEGGIVVGLEPDVPILTFKNIKILNILKILKYF